MSSVNEKLEQPFELASVAGGIVFELEPGLHDKMRNALAPDKIEILSQDPWIDVLGLNGNNVQFVNRSPDAVTGVNIKIAYDHSIEGKTVDALTSYTNLGAWVPGFAFGDFENVYVIGSADEGDTLQDCDYLHENGVTDAFEQAITAAGGRPARFIIRSGTYTRTDETAFPAGSVVEGEGRYNTIIQPDATGRALNQDAANLLFRELSFQAQAETVDNELVLIDGVQVRMENVLFDGNEIQTGSYTAMLRLDNGGILRANQTLFSTASDGGIAIVDMAGLDLQTDQGGCYLEQCQFVNLPIGISGAESENLYVHKTQFVNLVSDIALTGDTTNVYIWENIFTLHDVSSEIMIDIQFGGASTDVRNFQFFNNQVIPANGTDTAKLLFQFGRTGPGDPVDNIFENRIFDNRFYLIDLAEGTPPFLFTARLFNDNFSFSENKIFSATTPAPQALMSFNNVTEFHFQENYVEGVVRVEGGGATTHARNHIKDNDFVLPTYSDDLTHAVLWFDSIIGYDISGNQFNLEDLTAPTAANATPGIQVDNIVSECKISNNDMVNVPAGVNPVAGLLLADISSLQMDNNTIESFGATDAPSADLTLAAAGQLQSNNDRIFSSEGVGMELNFAAGADVQIDNGHISCDDTYNNITVVSDVDNVTLQVSNSRFYCQGNATYGIDMPHLLANSALILSGNRYTGTDPGAPSNSRPVYAGYTTGNGYNSTHGEIATGFGAIGSITAGAGQVPAVLNTNNIGF